MFIRTLKITLAAILLLVSPSPSYAQSWTTPRSWTTGELVTAAMMNAHVRDNLSVLRAGGFAVTSQAIGDLLCASSTTQFARLAAVATGQVLASAGTGTCPAYTASPSLTQVTLTGDVIVASGFGLTVGVTRRVAATTSGADITGAFSVTGASALNGGITVDTSAFTVADATGILTQTQTVNGANIWMTVNNANSGTGASSRMVFSNSTSANAAYFEHFGGSHSTQPNDLQLNIRSATGDIELMTQTILRTSILSSGELRHQGTEGANGVIQLYADEGDDPADEWEITALQVGNGLQFSSDAVPLLTLSTTSLANTKRYDSATLQPGVLALNSADDVGITTGDTVDFDTEAYDEAGNFAADIFTAPVTGRYDVAVAIEVTTSTACQLTLQLVTTARTYALDFYPAAGAGTYTLQGTVKGADMTATDTAFIKVFFGAGTLTVEGGSPNPVSYVSIRLVP